jgi:Secretion system C-terminal sorting domain
MKKLLLLCLCLQAANAVWAQDYQTLQASGFNADIIANGVNPSAASTSIALDNADYVLMAADFQPTLADIPPAYALPLSGLITDASIAGLSFQLASYSQSNSLRLQDESDFGALTFSNAVSATNLYVLAASGSGSVTLGGTIHFSDNSTQDFSAAVIPDWFFSNALPVVISGFGRVSRATDIIENPIGDPRMYRYEISILAQNQTKTITGIDFTKTSTTEGVANIFAVSAKLLGTCPSPTQLTSTEVTNFGATISWTASVISPTGGYNCYLTVLGAPAPLPTTLPTQSVIQGVTTTSFQGLIPGVTYCVYVRSVCGTEAGPWGTPFCFTPGQIDVTNPNDIPTLYSLTVDTSSTTSCPGILSVTVPAGFEVTSVSTSYSMQTALNGWMSEQRSILVCNTTGLMEPQITSGIGGTTGTYDYSRSNINIANGATGNVEFELRAWRTYGGADCNTDYNRVVAGTWTVSVIVQPQLSVTDFDKNGFTVYPNPAQDVLQISANETITELTLYNMLGQQVLHQNGANAKNAQLVTAGLPSGKYILKLASKSSIQSKGILKN